MIVKDKQKLVYIKWQDAHSVNGWLTRKDIEQKIAEEAFIIEQIGWIVYEDKKEIHMVSRRGAWNKNEDADIDEYGQYQRIPRTWILKRKEINIR